MVTKIAWLALGWWLHKFGTWTLSLFILLYLTSSFAAIIITAETRSHSLTIKLNMGFNKLLAHDLQYRMFLQGTTVRNYSKGTNYNLGNSYCVQKRKQDNLQMSVYCVCLVFVMRPDRRKSCKLNIVQWCSRWLVGCKKLGNDCNNKYYFSSELLLPECKPCLKVNYN